MRTPRDWLRWSSVVGIASAAFLAVCVNLLSGRFDHRWDATSDRRYTLCSATRATLASIREPTKAVVLLSRADSLAMTVQQMLAGYVSLNGLLTLRWVNPDRDPGQFLALQSELGIVAGATKDGKPVSDAIIVLTRGKTRSYVTTDDVVRVNPTTGESESRLEEALTRGLRQLAETSRPVVCITEGHRELNPQDQGPTGISEFYARLTREPIELKMIDLGAGRQSELAACRIVIVAAPDIPLSAWAQQQLQSFSSDQGSLLVLSNTIPDESGHVRASGLDPLVSAAGVTIGHNIVVEQDENLRLPDGFGESFFAQALDHAATRSLIGAGATNSLRVLVSLAPALSVNDSVASKVLLASSDKAIHIDDVGAYLRHDSGPNRAAPQGKRQALAVASELGKDSRGALRRLIVAPASVIENRALRVHALVGNRAFIDGALAWLLSRPVGIEIPNPRGAVLQLNLSEADLARLRRYTLMMMPAFAATLGLAFAFARQRRRRSQSPKERS